MKSEPSIPNRRVRLPWALVPVALLLSSALGVGWMAIVAVRDPHFAIEPDYYQKAIGWDRTQAQAATNQRLGYTITAPGVVKFDVHGLASLELTIRDRNGQPVTGAQLTARAFANAYSGKLLHVGFEEQAAGRYRAKFAVDHPGQWVLQLAGSLGGELFTADVRADLLPGGAA